MNGEMYAEISVGPDGAETLRLPDEIMAAPAKADALNAELVKLRAEVNLLKANRSDVPMSGKLRALGVDSPARERIDASLIAFQASVDKSAEINARIAAALEGLLKVIDAKQMTTTFAPTIQPAEVHNHVKAEVTARVQMPPRSIGAARVTNPDGTTSVIEFDGATS